MDNTQNLEPAAEDLLRAGKGAVEHMSNLPALYSIAISLKRIADEMQGDQNHLGLVSGVMMAIEQGFIAGKNG